MTACDTFFNIAESVYSNSLHGQAPSQPAGITVWPPCRWNMAVGRTDDGDESRANAGSAPMGVWRDGCRMTKLSPGEPATLNGLRLTEPLVTKRTRQPAVHFLVAVLLLFCLGIGISARIRHCWCKCPRCHHSCFSSDGLARSLKVIPRRIFPRTSNRWGQLWAEWIAPRDQPKSQAEQQRDQDDQRNFPSPHFLLPTCFDAFVHVLVPSLIRQPAEDKPTVASKN